MDWKFLDYITTQHAQPKLWITWVGNFIYKYCDSSVHNPFQPNRLKFHQNSTLFPLNSYPPPFCSTSFSSRESTKNLRSVQIILLQLKFTKYKCQALPVLINSIPSRDWGIRKSGISTLLPAVTQKLTDQKKNISKNKSSLYWWAGPWQQSASNQNYSFSHLQPTI